MTLTQTNLALFGGAPAVDAGNKDIFHKVAENYEALLADDPGNPSELGGWHFYQHR